MTEKPNGATAARSAAGRPPGAGDAGPQGPDRAPVALAPALPFREIFRRFRPWVHPDRWWLPVCVVLLVAGSAGEVVSVWLFKDLVDNVLVPRRFSAFWPLAAAMIGIAVLGALLAYLGQYAATRVAERFLLRLRTAVVEHLHTLPPDTLRRRWHGDVVARLTTDIDQIEQLVASGLIQAATALITLVFFAGAAFLLSWPLALAAFAAAPLFWFTARRFGARIQRLSREARRCEGGVTAVVEESLANSALAHAYNQQGREVERVRRQGRALMDADLATARTALAYPALLNVLEVVGGLFVVGLGAFELTRDALTIGGLLAFAAFLTQLFGPAQELSGLVASFGAAGAGAERVAELLTTEPPVRDRPGARPLTGVRGRLSCEGVRASYPGRRDRPALRHVTFDVAPGQVLGVTGPSGGGKSTLAKLLVRFMEPERGAVRVDGTDLRDATAVSVRDAVTLLPQEPQMFHASVRDNIAYGRPDATAEEVERAAADADADAFVRALPQGYDTVLGEDGLQLSGGQARRIAVARAFLRGTPVLVLDEPTAGLDAQAAARVVEPLHRLMAGRTTVLITHDPALLRHADAVLEISADGVGHGVRPADRLGSAGTA
ncbi:ABC transporter ATP-binding protein/permease [Streptacidiphilus sp. ASG 303]|uniref:ABC transporter ATP-binding protein n=1 Tax=Streptacidiphilus sp. ASG 303 TaxID=2896847 RepID=UPI001E4169F9|nr:ABC transporter ATP-binding protein [Streptacidiphilus sp. ASG 303]MCD0480930.1 ABC transporter ATP-binding protein/permease [Streptacidiphilus sp. ASG 303]